AGTDVGIKQIVNGLNQVLTKDTNCMIALETMAGKGSEIGCTFEELAAITSANVKRLFKKIK
ncbi:MAG: hypothetical protein II203_01810, partial [Phascolarctobacterium sp.]|nr:hypothetical protein [Phascolarctobacterium sp.]